MDTAPLLKLRSAGYEVVDNPYKRKLTKQELLQLLTDDTIGLIAGLETIDRDVLLKSKLRVVSRVGSGISNVDVGAAKELGIQVFSTPAGPTEAVAELTVGAMICLVRMVSAMDNALHNGLWDKKIGFQVEGKTVMIIGFGRIGRRVAELLKPFHVVLLIVDPFLQDEDARPYRRLSLEHALPQADIISLHCGGETCVLGDREFALMKRGVFILNAARGGVMSEDALKTNLESGLVAGAWLDTFKSEPYRDSLSAFSNVLLTPHVGSYTRESRLQMETEAVENLLKGLG